MENVELAGELINEHRRTIRDKQPIHIKIAQSAMHSVAFAAHKLNDADSDREGSKDGMNCTRAGKAKHRPAPVTQLHSTKGTTVHSKGTSGGRKGPVPISRYWPK